MFRRRIAISGFTMAELVVCSAIATMAFVFTAPALNKGRDATDRLRCENNLRQLSQAQLQYANAHGGLPPMALSFDLTDYRATQPGPGSWYDGHSWYSLIGPYIGEPEWASLINLSVSVSSSANEPMRRAGLRLKIHACPADIGLQRNEWASATWARVGSNYVVNAGNTNYGQTNDVNGDPPVVFLGAPFAGGKITPLTTITDGVSNTLMMSEVPVLPGCTGWGGAYSEIQSSWGGQVFTGYRWPNPNVADIIGYARNGNGACDSVAAMNARYTAAGVVPVPISSAATNPYQTSIAARSKHAGGVNATLCDGSAGFITNDIDPTVWRALSTARGSDFVPVGQAPATVTKVK